VGSENSNVLMLNVHGHCEHPTWICSSNSQRHCDRCLSWTYHGATTRHVHEVSTVADHIRRRIGSEEDADEWVKPRLYHGQEQMDSISTPEWTQLMLLHSFYQMCRYLHIRDVADVRLPASHLGLGCLTLHDSLVHRLI
jgi:hypothetical protein